MGLFFKGLFRYVIPLLRHFYYTKTLKMNSVCSWETLEFIYQTSRCHNPGDQNLYNDGREMVNFLPVHNATVPGFS